MAAQSGSKSDPSLAQNNKKAPKTSPATFTLLQLRVCSWHQNDAKQILKKGTNQKQAKKDAEEHVTRSMPDTLFKEVHPLYYSNQKI